MVVDEPTTAAPFPYMHFMAQAFDQSGCRRLALLLMLSDQNLICYLSKPPFPGNRF